MWRNSFARRGPRRAAWREKAITEVCKLTVKEAAALSFPRLQLSGGHLKIADRISGRDSNAVCSFLDEVGLDYLSLDRLTSTLSARRIAADPARNVARFRIIVGALYVLDETFHRPPSARHAEAHRYSQVASAIWGNTVLVVAARSGHHPSRGLHHRSRSRRGLNSAASFFFAGSLCGHARGAKIP